MRKNHLQAKEVRRPAQPRRDREHVQDVLVDEAEPSYGRLLAGQAADPVVIAPVLRAESGIGSPFMEMLRGEQIAESNLTDWRKLAQGLHARYVIDDFGTGARFVAAAGRGN